MNKFITAVSNLIWYISPHHSKFVAHGASFPTVYNHLLLPNDPSRHKHKIPKICREALRKLRDKLIECCSKYHDYLESNLKAVSKYQSFEEPKHIETVVELPHLDGPLDGKYKNRRELLAIEIVEEKLGTLDFYDPVCLDEIFPKDKAHRYMRLKHLKESGCSIKNVIVFTKHCGPASGYTHFVLKEDLHSDTLTNRQETIHTISKSLPKCFSKAHKSKCKSLVSLLMHDKHFSSSVPHPLFRTHR